MKKPKIYFRNSGIASMFIDKTGKWIEMNSALKKYPKLYNAILKHEMKHYRSKNKFIDFKIDTFDKPPKGLGKFILKHPSSLTEFLPVWTNYRGQLAPNWYLVVLYSLFIVSLMILKVVLSIH